jgi:hypothetical protein
MARTKSTKDEKEKASGEDGFHFNIVIATPANGFTPGYVQSLLQTVVAIQNEGLTWTFLSHGGSLVSMVRELVIGGPEANSKSVTKPYNGLFSYDMILWIDSDIIWDPSDVFRLYRSKKQIVSGCYLLENRSTPIYLKDNSRMMHESEVYEYAEPFKVRATGFGFLGVKNGVFENIERPWFGPVSSSAISVDEESDIQNILVGEDVSWCLKAESAGFDVWVDPSVKVIHQKTFPIIWSDTLQKQQFAQ